MTPSASARNQPMGTAHRSPQPRRMGYAERGVCKRNPRAERHDGEDDRHAGLPKRPVKSVEKEQDADQGVECAFDPQVADAFCDHGRLAGVDEKGHERPGKDEDQQGDDQAENRGGYDSCADALADPVRVSCP